MENQFNRNNYGIVISAFILTLLLLISNTQNYIANAIFDKASIYDDLNTGIMSSNTQFLIADCQYKLKEYNGYASALKASPTGQALNDELLKCDHNMLFLDGVCQAVGTKAIDDPNSFCKPAKNWIDSRGINNEPRPDSII